MPTSLPSQPVGGVLASPSDAAHSIESEKIPGPKPFPNVQKIVSSLPVDHYGTSVYVKGWRPETPPSADRHPILIVHDLGEHAGLYREAALTFVENGYATYGFDLRGHGRSGRRLGHASSFNVLVKDLLQVAAWVRRNEGGKPPIILGQGIGALIALEFTKSYGSLCKAVILSAPVLELSAKVSWFTRAFLKIMADVSPTMRLPKRLNPRFAKDFCPGAKDPPVGSRDGDEQSAAEVSRNNFFPRLTAVFANELLQATTRAKASFVEYRGLVLILCPVNDAICTYTHLKKSAVLHADDNVQIRDLPNCAHHVFTEDEPTRQAAFKIILPWLTQHLDAEGKGANG